MKYSKLLKSKLDALDTSKPKRSGKRGRPQGTSLWQYRVLAKEVLTIVRRAKGPMSKQQILDAMQHECNLGAWNKLSKALVEAKALVLTGHGRGARYSFGL